MTNRLKDAFAQAGQGHVFQYYDELPAAAQEALLAQAAMIDLVELEELVAQHLGGSGEAGHEMDAIEPAPYIALPAHGGEAADWAEAVRTGDAAIRAGKVAAFTVAGGQGTRLGYDGPKGTFPVTPLTRKTLFQVFAEKIRRSGERYGVQLHWFILTSMVNNTATVDAFEANDYHGLDREQVHFVVQGLMPAVDYNGKILLADKGSIAMTPDGHGGALRALARGGAVATMERLGVEALSYFQVDNPLVRCIDPAFVGFHLNANSELSSKMTPKAYATEKVGMFCKRGDHLEVIEYSDMPAAMQAETTADGTLRFNAGSIAIHMFDRGFIQRVGSGEDAACKLPFHRADKKIPTLDAAGQAFTPEKPNGVKFEMFVFDALPLAANPVIIEIAREDDFSPVKNAEGVDSPETSANDQLRMFARWLRAAGVEVDVDATGLPLVRIEISHRFAADEADFIEQWAALKTKPEITDGLVIE